MTLPSQPQADPEVNVYCVINCTFFSKKKSKFFGRTYKSEPIKLVETTKGTRSFETSDHHTVYCHTLVDDVSDSTLVVELEIKGSRWLTAQRSTTTTRPCRTRT